MNLTMPLVCCPRHDDAGSDQGPTAKHVGQELAQHIQQQRWGRLQCDSNGLNLAQDRSCREKRKSTRVCVILRFAHSGDLAGWHGDLGAGSRSASVCRGNRIHPGSARVILSVETGGLADQPDDHSGLCPDAAHALYHPCTDTRPLSLSPGDPSIFFTRPVAGPITIVALVLIALPANKLIRRTRPCPS